MTETIEFAVAATSAPAPWSWQEAEAPMTMVALDALWPAPSSTVEFAASVVRTISDSYWLGGEGLIRPVQARIDVDAHGFAAHEANTGIFGYGDSLAEALTDLRHALHDHLALLAEEAELSADLQAQLDFLRNHVRAE